MHSNAVFQIRRRFRTKRFLRGIFMATTPIKRIYTRTDDNVHIFFRSFLRIKRTTRSVHSRAFPSDGRRHFARMQTERYFVPTRNARIYWPEKQRKAGFLFYYYYTSHGSRPKRTAYRRRRRKDKADGDITSHSSICMKNKFSFQEQKSFNNVHVVYAYMYTCTHTHTHYP